MSFSIARHFGIGTYHPRKTVDSLVALHLLEKLLCSTFDIPLRFRAVEARDGGYENAASDGTMFTLCFWLLPP